MDVDLLAQRPKPTFTFYKNPRLAGTRCVGAWFRKAERMAFDRTRATTWNRPIAGTDAERNSQIHCIPQCTHAIHSTRAKNLSTDTTPNAKRNSGVRRQFAVFEVTAFPKATTLKTSTAANQGKKLSSAAGDQTNDTQRASSVKTIGAFIVLLSPFVVTDQGITLGS